MKVVTKENLCGKDEPRSKDTKIGQVFQSIPTKNHFLRVDYDKLNVSQSVNRRVEEYGYIPCLRIEDSKMVLVEGSTRIVILDNARVVVGD